MINAKLTFHLVNLELRSLYSRLRNSVFGNLDLKTELQRGNISAAGHRYAIVVSRWNHALTSRLADGATKALLSVGANADSIETFWVPGAFELPLACLSAARTGRFDAVIALGVVIRGETPHFHYVAGQAASGITHVSLSTSLPVMFGVITAETHDQAEARSGETENNKGYEAAISAVEMVAALSEIKERSDASVAGEKVFPYVV